MDPVGKGVKVKRSVLIIVIAVLVLGSAALGYLYYSENQDLKNLSESNADLQGRYEVINTKLERKVTDLTGGTESLTGEKSTLSTENTTLTDENDTLAGQVEEYAAGMAKIKAYNDFLKYYNSVIETHGGFTGWTDAEFQTAQGLANVTGDTSFVNTINWAWYEISIPAVDRIIRVQKEIAAGIEGGLI